MTSRAAIGLLQGGRAALGAVLVVAPQAIGERWIGGQAATQSGQIALRALGARDLVLGLGAMRAARRGDARSVAAWCVALAACDTVDGLATVAAREEIPNAGVPTMALAFGAAVAGLYLASQV